MVRRLAAVSALVLAAFAATPAAHAQSFFSPFEASPRDVVDQLYEQGYTVRLPMVRRGDVYVVDAVSSSHRPMRLIVSTRDGRVLQRFATAPRWSDDEPGAARWRDDEASRAPDDSDDPRWERRTRTALGDPDSDFDTRPVPPAPLADDPDKAKRHAHKRHDMSDVGPKPDASVASTPPDPQPSPAKSIDNPLPKPAPTPTSQAKVEPAPTAKQTVTAIPQAKAEDKPAPRVIPLTKPTPEAKVEDKPVVKTVEAPAPKAAKPETPHKKLNDLPVGTLD